MALIKEPYGLVYNTDGTLCTTYRDDNVPFRGVRSFAVETATTNLLGNTVFDTAIFTITAMGGGTILNHLPGKGLYGSMLTRATKSDNMTENFISAARPIQVFFIPQAGKTYTYSVYARLYGKQSNQSFKLHHYDGKHFLTNVGLLTPEWKRYSYTFTVRPEYTGGTFLIYNQLEQSSVEIGSGFEICLPQVEQKPFASSFVDGSRPYGRFELENTASIDMTNLVLCGWFKFFDVSATSSPRRIIEKATAGEGADGFTLIFSNIMDFYVDRTRVTVMSSLEAQKWYYIILIFDNGVNTARIYDEDTIHESVITKTVPENDKNIYLGSSSWQSGQNILNGLVSNFFIGKYKKSDGTVIWTDEYIREVYEAKIPYPAQNKLSIY